MVGTSNNAIPGGHIAMTSFASNLTKPISRGVNATKHFKTYGALPSAELVAMEFELS